MAQLQAIREGVEGLRAVHTGLKDVVRTCVTEDPSSAQTLAQLKERAINALDSVVYQIFTTGNQFGGFLQEQLDDLEGSIATARVISQRLDVDHQVASRNALRDFEPRDRVVIGSRMTKRTEGFTPVDDRVPNWIDFSAYDKVGIPFLVEKSQPPPISLYSTPSAPSAVAMSVGQQQAQAQPDRGVLSYNRNRQSVAASTLGAPPPPPTAPAEQSCVVMYDYEAATDEELTISAGDILVVTQEDAGDGWMEGRDSSGRKGLFPASYVELT